MAERLLVYDSHFGNTSKVAEVIGEAIGASVLDSEDLLGEGELAQALKWAEPILH